MSGARRRPACTRRAAAAAPDARALHGASHGASHGGALADALAVGRFAPARTSLAVIFAALAAAAVLALTARPAAAHPLDLGYLRITADDTTVTAALDLDAAAAGELLGLPAAAIDAPALTARAAALADLTLRRAPLAGDAGPCAWTTAAAALAGRTVTITATAACPSGTRTLRWPLPFVADPRVASTFQLLVKADLGGSAGELVTTVDRGTPELVLDRGARLGFVAFVWSGVEHIGAAPSQWRDPDGGWQLADGIDHILFLLALLLAGGTILQLAGIATGFTLGHSITLALSGLGVVRPPASLIEPVIALSIALVAAQACLGLRERARWQIATGFGLVHGFGFAGALHELDLPTAQRVPALAGYNLGVELGQLAIVVAVAPAVLALQRYPRAHRITVRVVAAAIFIAGAYWFGARLAG